jgi:hypothetical protein
VDVLAIILACSLHPDDALVRALVEVQSGGNAYFVGDLATLKTNDALTSPEAALRYAEDLAKHGGKPAVGLLGVPLSWASRYGRSPIDLFDACTNVSVATAAFAEYQQRCAPARLRTSREPAPSPRGRHRRRRPNVAGERACVLSRFALDLGLTAAPAAILRRLGPAADGPSNDGGDPPPQRSLVFVDDTEAEPGTAVIRPRQRIFLDATATSHAVR